MKLSLNQIVFYSREISLDWFAFFYSAFIQTVGCDISRNGVSQ